MANVVGELPQFTTDDSAGNQKVIEEVKEPLAETPIEEVLPEEGKETPAELPAEDKPVDVPDPKGKVSEDTEDKQVQGILTEREKLLQEIVELRKERRTLRQEETKEIITEAGEKLDDLNPDDVKNIDRVLKAKGYITKAESQKIIYESVKNEELNKFLDKFPEYKAENDKNDVNWTALQREMSLYKTPENPRQVAELLLRAHRNISGTRTSVDRPAQTVTKRIATAQKGSGGVQRSSSTGKLSEYQRNYYLDHGWSKEEVDEMDK